VCIGDVVIHPGDIVIGDRDGLVVVARDEVDHAIRISLAREDKEAHMREAIQAGTSNTAALPNLGDALKRFGLV
jgi:4-hydroxy-4-methyl-2-oxoglutarate aldolase